MTGVRRAAKIVGMWALIGALAAGGVASLSSNSPDETPRFLNNVELVATATTFESFFYFNNGNPNRGFHGELDSTDNACKMGRSITVYLQDAGSVTDLPVATSTSATGNSSGNWSSTNYIDPPGEQSYYAVVAPDEEKDCEGATSETIVVDF